MNGIDERSRRLARVLRVQRQRRELEEWRLAHLRQERTDLERQDAEVLESLGDPSALQGLFLDAKVRTLKRNDREKQRNEQEQHATAARLGAAKRLEKGVERAHGEAQRDARSAGEKTALEAALESLAARGASFE